MPNDSRTPSLTRSAGDYLKAIRVLSHDTAATTNDLARALDVAPASASQMLAKLHEDGLVTYRPYRGATLTPRGEREALRLLRRHRLVETFMIDRLGYTWDEVHDEAERIEHAISDRFAEGLARLLAHPQHDPHGDPIPRADGTLPDTPALPLAELEPGQTLRVARLLTQDGDVLAHLAALAIQPGARVTVRSREPLGGLLHIAVDGAQQALSKDLATLVRGEVAT